MAQQIAPIPYIVGSKQFGTYTEEAISDVCDELWKDGELSSSVTLAIVHGMIERIRELEELVRKYEGKA